MNIIVTGAGGFIGRNVVNTLIQQGHHVQALVRNTTQKEWQSEARITEIKCDLMDGEFLEEALQAITATGACDAVVHLAAVMSGDAETQYNETLQSTRNLLHAMDKAGIKVLVGLSSISVLDYVNTPALNTISESTPLAQNDADLGPYALTKRDQEKLIAEWGCKTNNSLTILRPGMVYSEDVLSAAHVGFVRGRRALAAMHSGDIPIVHVESLANSIVHALSVTQTSNTNTNLSILHIIDSELPKQNDYLKALRTLNNAHGNITQVIKLPWKVYGVFCSIIRTLLAICGLAKTTPDTFRRNSVAARQKPFKFSNQKAQSEINWTPYTGFPSKRNIS